MRFPGKNFVLANVTHFETPLDPLGTARMVFEGRRQADNVIRFLRAEFPASFRNAQVRAYGNPGLRQTRWIVGRQQLTLDEIRSGARPADAARALCVVGGAARHAAGRCMGEVPDDHVYYIPLALHGVPETPTTSSPPGGAWMRTCALSSDPRHGSVHRDGRGRRARARSRRVGQRAAKSMHSLRQRVKDNVERVD